MKIHSFLMLIASFGLMLFLNCEHKSSNQEANKSILKTDSIFKVYNQNMGDLVEYRLDKNLRPQNDWNFYNDKGGIILNISFDSISKDYLLYNVVLYDSEGKINYSSRIFNGEIQNETTCEDLQIVNRRNGKFLFDTHIKTFYYMEHDKLPNGKRNYLETILENLLMKYPEIPDFTENEKEAILLYMRDPEIIIGD